MANTKTLVDNGTGPAVTTVRLDTTGVIELGDAAMGAVGSWVLQISGTFSGSLVLKKRMVGSVVPNSSASNTYYFDFLAGSTDVTAGTALTAAGIVKVPCDGCSLVLSYTHTSGAMIVEAVPLLG